MNIKIALALNKWNRSFYNYLQVVDKLFIKFI